MTGTVVEPWPGEHGLTGVHEKGPTGHGYQRERYGVKEEVNVNSSGRSIAIKKEQRHASSKLWRRRSIYGAGRPRQRERERKKRVVRVIELS